MGTAVERWAPDALPLSDRHRTPVFAGCLEQPERHEVDVRDRVGAGLGRRGGEIRSRLEAAEEIRLLEDHRRSV